MSQLHTNAVVTKALTDSKFAAELLNPLKRQAALDTIGGLTEAETDCFMTAEGTSLHELIIHFVNCIEGKPSRLER